MKLNILKKILILVLALCLIAAMTACGKDEPEGAPDGDTLPVTGEDLDGEEYSDAETEAPDDAKEPDDTENPNTDTDKQDKEEPDDSQASAGPAPDQKPDPEKRQIFFHMANSLYRETTIWSMVSPVTDRSLTST